MNNRKAKLSMACGPRWLAPSRLVALGVMAALALPCGSASAQTSAQQKAVAEALFDEANRLMEEGQYGAACERFEQSQKADPGVGTLLNLGRCYALTGRLASAWAIYREAASAARASGQGERARIAEEDARELRPRLSELALLVPANQPRGYELLMDGNLVSSVQFGLSVPVDAGQHTLVARAPGYEQWSSAVQIGGSAARKTVQIPVLSPLALEPAATSSAPPLVLAPSTSSDAASHSASVGPTADSGTSSSLSGQRLTGVLVAGGGLLAIGAGVAIGAHAQSMDDEAQQVCGAQGCYDPMGADMNQSARNWALAANVTFAAGGLALATGAILFFTAHDEPPPAEQSGSWRVVPTLGNGSLGNGPGVVLDGKF